MQPSYACMVVDDDEVDRLTTVSFVERFPFLEIKGVFSSAYEALGEARKQKPDAIFLDVDMPGMDGLELRESLLSIPACIFITSYPEYAVDAFDRSALDFLVKPIRADRFAVAMERLRQYLDARRKSDLYDYSLNVDTLFIKEGYDHVKIKLQDVIYLEALKDYTGIITSQKKHCVLSPLGALLKEDAFRSFVRIHRSYAVQKNFVRQVTPSQVMVFNTPLPVGRQYKDNLKLLLE
jgi:two-component system LytT family response regulator